MNKEEFIKAITFLAIAYNKEFSQEQVSVWYEFFRNENYDVLRQAVKRVIPTETFMPSIARLKQEIALIKNPTLQLDASAEWDKAMDVIHKYGRYETLEILKNVPPEIADILRRIGLNKIFDSENISWERKQFIDMFNNNKKDIEKVNLLSENVLTEYEIDNTLNSKYLLNQ